MNKNKHVKVDVVDQEAAADLINSPRFSTLDELSENCFEVIVIHRIITIFVDIFEFIVICCFNS